MTGPLSGARVTALMCLAEILTMAGFGTFAALLPALRAEWGLSNAAAGWIEGAHQAGYLIAVPALVGLTDRIDARRIYLASAALGAAALAGFALLANDLWSACLFRALAGIGLAGTFMPGLKILSDATEGKSQSRAVAFYTASFSLGGSLSVLAAGGVAALLGWRWAFAVAAILAAAAILVAAIVVPSHAPPAKTAGRRFLDLRPVLASRQAVAYSLAYAAHMWELYGFRAWLVAFLSFSAADRPVILVASLILALALPASVLGNEAALRFGRRRTLMVVMPVSAAVAAAVGFSAALPFALTAAVCALYSVCVSADSAALTAGAVAAAPPSQRGAAMAFHTLIGFAAASVGPLTFGAVLDLADDRRTLAWGLAFATLGLGVALGPLLLRAVAGAAAQPDLRMTKT